MSFLIPDEAITKAVRDTISSWMNSNREAILDNISDTIREWMDDNKDEILGARDDDS